MKAWQSVNCPPAAVGRGTASYKAVPDKRDEGIRADAKQQSMGLAEASCSGTNHASSLGAPAGTAADGVPMAYPFDAFLREAEERARGAWTRTGIAGRDQEARWSQFVEGRLLPLIQDFVHLQESEERQVTLENDRLLLDVLLLSVRLAENPQAAGVFRLIRAVTNAHRATATSTERTWDPAGDGSHTKATAVAEASGATSLVVPTTNRELGFADGRKRPRSASVLTPYDVGVPPTATLGNGGKASDDGDCDSDAGAEDHDRARLIAEVGENAYSIPSFATVALVHGSAAPGLRKTLHESRQHGPAPANGAVLSHLIPYSDSFAMEEEVSRLLTIDPVHGSGGSSEGEIVTVMSELLRDLTHKALRDVLRSEYFRLNELADVRLQQLCLLRKQMLLATCAKPSEQHRVRQAYARRLFSDGGHPAKHDEVVGLTLSAGRDSSGLGQALSRATSSTHQTVDVGPVGRVTPATEAATLDTELWLLEGLDDEVARTACLSTDADDDRADRHRRPTVFEADVGDVVRLGKRQDLSRARIEREARHVIRRVRQNNDALYEQLGREWEQYRDLWELIRAPPAGTATASSGDETASLPAPRDGAIPIDVSFFNDVPSLEVVEARLKEMQCDYFGNGRLDDSFEEVYAALHRGHQQLRFVERLLLTRASPSSSHPSSGCSSRSMSLYPQKVECPRERGTVSYAGSDAVVATLLPKSFVKLFFVKSAWPLVEFVSGAREELQRRLLGHHMRHIQRLSQRLAASYEEYYALTRSAAFATPPDYMLWMTAGPATGRVSPPEQGAQPSCVTGARQSRGPKALPSDPQHVSSEIAARGDLDRLLGRASRVIAKATAEAMALDQLLSLVKAMRPLLQQRREILRQQSEIQNGRRERLLSKSINMAQQLLFEENARRQFERDLPKIHMQLRLLWEQWIDCSAARVASLAPRSSPGACGDPTTGTFNSAEFLPSSRTCAEKLDTALRFLGPPHTATLTLTVDGDNVFEVLDGSDAYTKTTKSGRPPTRQALYTPSFNVTSPPKVAERGALGTPTKPTSSHTRANQVAARHRRGTRVGASLGESPTPSKPPHAAAAQPPQKSRQNSVGTAPLCYAPCISTRLRRLQPTAENVRACPLVSPGARAVDGARSISGSFALSVSPPPPRYGDKQRLSPRPLFTGRRGPGTLPHGGVSGSASSLSRPSPSSTGRPQTQAPLSTSSSHRRAECEVGGPCSSASAQATLARALSPRHAKKPQYSMSASALATTVPLLPPEKRCIARHRPGARAQPVTSPVSNASDGGRGAVPPLPQPFDALECPISIVLSDIMDDRDDQEQGSGL